MTRRFDSQKKERCRKGQFFSYDAIVAGLLFILLLTLLYTYWNSLRSTISVKIDDITRIAMDASNLLMTPGFPYDWTSSDYNQLGLASGYNSIYLDSQKIGSLQEVPYETIRQKLAISPYDFYLEIGNETAGIIPEGALSKVTIRRPVVLDNELTNLSLTVWSRLS